MFWADFGSVFDADIEPSTNQGLVPELKNSPMTRSKTRRLREGFNTAVETLLNSSYIEDYGWNNPNVCYTPDLDIMEDFARLSIKEAPPQNNQGMTVYLTGKGVQNNKNHLKSLSDLQDITNSSYLADSEHVKQGEDYEDIHEATTKEINQYVFKGLQEDGIMKKYTENKHPTAAFLSALKPHHPSPNQVFSVYSISAGTLEQPTGV